MAKAYVFYNPLAGKGSIREELSALQMLVRDEAVLCDMTKPETYESSLFSLGAEDYIILCGGDGTLNRFVNFTDGTEIKNEILYYPIGTGNDFALDLGKHFEAPPFCITEYLKDLPYVEVKRRKYRFLNGVGYGIDGYCCEIGDKLKKADDKPRSVSSIAIRGLLFHYRPTNARVTVDGITHTYNRVWLAPTMNGRFYGGGMMPTPNQSRKGSGRMLSVMVLHDSGKLKTLAVFPSIFKGKHIAHKKIVDVLTGHRITVEFDRPTALHIDGELILNVSSYTASLPPAPPESAYACAAS